MNLLGDEDDELLKNDEGEMLFDQAADDDLDRFLREETELMDYEDR